LKGKPASLSKEKERQTDPVNSKEPAVSANLGGNSPWERSTRPQKKVQLCKKKKRKVPNKEGGRDFSPQHSPSAKGKNNSRDSREGSPPKKKHPAWENKKSAPPN